MDEVVEYFEGVADEYDEVLPFFSSFARDMVDRIAPQEGMRALDVCAGRGALAAELLARGVDTVAVDGAPRMVELLARDLPSAESRVMDATALDLPDEGFDLVVCAFALHIIAAGEIAFAEMCRVLRPGGLLGVVVPGRADGSPEPWDDPMDDLFDEYRRFQPDGDGRHGNDLDVAELIAAAGLDDASAATLEVAIPVPDGDTYWRWIRSQGAGRFIEKLPEDKRLEMYALLVAAVAAEPGFMLRRSATLHTARKPA